MSTVSEVFTRIWDGNLWRSRETRCGSGSTLRQSQRFIRALQVIIRAYGIQSILDAGCGDWNWMKVVKLGSVDYQGCDVVRSAIEGDVRRYGRPNRRFFVADVTRDALPTVDLILCRAVFWHLSNELILAALDNFSRSGSRLLLTSNHPEVIANLDTELGGFRVINLRIAPFNLPMPIAEYPDGRQRRDGYMALWSLRDLGGEASNG